jgi:glutathione synthase
MRVAIISEKLGTDASSSSTVMAAEAIARGFKVFEFEAADITYKNGQLVATCKAYPSGKAAIKTLAKDFDVILFRPNPPVNMAYLTTLFLLKTIADKVLILNNPDSVITLPEKISPLYLSKYAPPTVITRQKTAALEFLKTHKTVIVKPLYDYGGKGIVKTNSANVLANLMVGSDLPLVIQKFLPDVAIKGDKRLMFIDGKFYGAVQRVPKKGSFLANIYQGGSLQKTVLTKKEQQVAKELEKLLKENDIMIAGVDMVCGMITEINITSPTGFKWIEDYHNINLKKILWDIICKRLKALENKS